MTDMGCFGTALEVHVTDQEVGLHSLEGLLVSQGAHHVVLGDEDEGLAHSCRLPQSIWPVHSRLLEAGEPAPLHRQHPMQLRLQHNTVKQ